MSGKISRYVNLMHLDEQKTLATNDYLEQTFEILSSLNKIVGNKPLIAQKTAKMEENPDNFPIYNLTKTEFELEYLFDQPEVISQIKRTIGFYPEIKPSSIDHQYAGEGVFLGARQAALPGTLIGFYPGVVIKKLVNEFRTVNKMEEKPYLNRHSGVALDPSIEVPYPLKPFVSLTELEFELSEEMEKRGIPEIKHILTRIDKFNPYAVGHKINHPFPGKEANVKFVDFKVDFNFFPEDFVKFIPNVKMLV